MTASSFVTTGRLEGGKLSFRKPGVYREWLATQRPGEYVVTIERARAARSLQQNGWYWGCIVEAVSEHTGYTPDEVHQFLKAKFIPKKLAVSKGNGEIVDELVVGGSTARMNKIEFSEYCESIREWAAMTLDLDIPSPQEYEP